MHSSNRINSVDALRGLTVAAMLVVNDAGDWGHVFPWIEHADWNGCTLADFIYPFFMLIVGVSLNLALGSKRAVSVELAPLSRAVLLRAARIVLLGLALHFIASLLLHGRAFRLLGVLQRTGICFAAAGMIALYLPKARTQWTIFAAILLGYWALLASSGALLPDVNLADRIDTALLGHLAYQYDPASGRAHDPEGILGTLPALATVLLGMRAGAWLQAAQVRRLALAGVIAVATAAGWSVLLPLNKQLWTSSFVLWTGGFGMLALALAHQLIDVCGWPPLGRAMGVNAIAAYAGSWLATCVLEGYGIMPPLYREVFAQHLTPLFGAEIASLTFALAFTAVFWLLMALFYRRGWRVTI